MSRRVNNWRRDQETASIIEELVRLHGLQTNLFGRLNSIRLEQQAEEQEEYNRPRSDWSQALGHSFRFGDRVIVKNPTDRQPERGIVTRVNSRLVTIQGRRGSEFMFEPNELEPETAPHTLLNNDQQV